VKFAYIAAVVAVVAAIRVAVYRRRRGRRLRGGAASPLPERGADAGGATNAQAGGDEGGGDRGGNSAGVLGSVGLVAAREIRERVRGRIFKVGTLFILLGVGAAIVIPKIHSGGTTPPQKVGVVGATSPALTQVVTYAGKQCGTPVQIVAEPSVAAAERALQAGTIHAALVDDAQKILVDEDVGPKASSTTATCVQALAADLGVLRAYEAAGLSDTQIAQVAHARPVPVENLQGKASKGAAQTTSVIGIILLFVMLTQYNTWILMGVMQEKASRVVEVLLAALRPIQLLGGKVLGIGMVAMGQAALIVGFALVVGAAVGSDLLHGTAPLVLLAELLWLVLGYAFYCWVYAAAGSMAERQDQVQTLVLPLTLPMLLGYVLAITTASTGNPSLFFKVLAYLPPTAPFAMPVLVGLGDVAWWGFVTAVLLSVAGTVAMAWGAAGIYRRAVLRSGQRVRLGDLTTGSWRSRHGDRDQDQGQAVGAPG
jgi:ABC-2 type transport system permease protein